MKTLLETMRPYKEEASRTKELYLLLERLVEAVEQAHPDINSNRLLRACTENDIARAVGILKGERF